VACTKAPRFAALAMLQPDAAGVMPPAPVSCHGVDRPVALSGAAGTMRTQFTFATATGVVAVAVGVTVGQIVGVADAVVVVVAVAVGATVAVTDVVGVAVGVILCLLWPGLPKDENLIAD
jgi:hypothetical protein